MGIGIITNSATTYLWSFIGKFVIDIVQQQAASPDKDIAPLLKLLLIITAVELLLYILNTITDNKRWYYFINVRMHMITERVAKVLSMNYQMLEQPKILDMHQKGTEATGGNSNGVEGLMYSVYNLGVQLLLLLVTVSAVTVLDWRMLLILTGISVLQYLFFRYTVQKDKKQVWDMLAPTWRKINYMTRTTQDFDYAKDIRLFHMQNWLSSKQHEILTEKQNKIYRSRNLWTYNTVFAHTMNMLTTAVIYGILIFSVIDKNMSIGNFTLYLGLCTTFTATLSQLLNSLGDYKRRSLEVDDFRSFMDLKTEENEDALPVPETDSYTFTFQNVSYRYEGA